MLEVGSKVVMNDKYWVSEKNKGKVFTVIAGPKEVCGIPCVWMDGFSSCYAVDGLEEVEEC
jgi:hypothetical protein